MSKDWKKIGSLLGNLAENHKDVLFSMVGLSVVKGIRPFISVILMGMLVDAAYAGVEFSEMLHDITAGVGGIFLLAAADGVLTMFFNRKLEYMQEIQARPLNQKSMKMDYEYLEDSDVHEMRQRIERMGGWSLTARVLSQMHKILNATVTVVMAVFVAVPMFVRSSHPLSEGFVGSWLLSVLLVAVILALVFVEFRLGIYLHEREADARKEMAGCEAKNKYYLDILSGCEEQKDLRSCRQQRLYEREFEESAAGIKTVVDKMAHFNTLNIFSQRTIAALTGFLVYAFAGLLACAGMISVGGVVTYAASILKFTEGMGRLVYVLSWLGGNVAFAGDYLDYMALPQRKREGCIPLEKRRDNRFLVEFDHVSFRYPGSDAYVIRDLSLKFEIGEKMAIVGKNGSGKTTFIKLLCRLYDVTEGCIRVNGIDIRKYDYAEYCDLFAVVFQDFQVFAFPLGENVAAGRAQSMRWTEPEWGSGTARCRMDWIPVLERNLTKTAWRSLAARSRRSRSRAPYTKMLRLSSWTSRLPRSTRSPSARCTPVLTGWSGTRHRSISPTALPRAASVRISLYLTRGRWFSAAGTRSWSGRKVCTGNCGMHRHSTTSR